MSKRREEGNWGIVLPTSQPRVTTGSLTQSTHPSPLFLQTQSITLSLHLVASPVIFPLYLPIFYLTNPRCFLLLPIYTSCPGQVY